MRIAVPLSVWDESEGKGFRKHPVNHPGPVNERPAIGPLDIRVLPPMVFVRRVLGRQDDGLESPSSKIRLMLEPDSRRLILYAIGVKCPGQVNGTSSSTDVLQLPHS
jgi:hypothetical protein